jgi:hypothetical protein
MHNVHLTVGTWVAASAVAALQERRLAHGLGYVLH